MLAVLVAIGIVRGAVLAVGDGKPFARIEDALSAAKSGDSIEVYPSRAGYTGAAIMVRKSHVAIRGMGEKRIVIDGAGFVYSGEGRVPRAIVQFDPEANGCSISHFELRNAHNASFNGSGVRINHANDVTVSDCDIHDNDMGIMSNGVEGDPTAGSNQLITHCLIHRNGSLKDPGYNHNLYLGGTSVTVEFCDIYGSLTGHNLKSRAHYILVRYCKIHDAANRECDFVEAWDTERANSNAVLIGNVIAKDPQCSGNRMTIHFGREKGLRNGTLFLVNNTILTPFFSPVVGLDSPQAALFLTNNVIVNAQESHPILVEASSGALIQSVSGSNNWISKGYDLSQTGVKPGWSGGGSVLEQNRSVGGSLGKPVRVNALDGEGRPFDASPTYRFKGGGWEKSAPGFIGAG